MACTFTIPMPPSVNALFANVSPAQRAAAAAQGKKLPGRMKTAAYRAWIKEAGWTIRAQRPLPTPGRVEVGLSFERHSDRADVDGRIKATLDLMVTMGLIDDDRHVMRLVTEWTGAGGCVVDVRPWRDPTAMKMAG